MTAALKVSIEHNGVTYSGDYMRIKKTALGYEDHGILTAYLICEGSGSGISVGGYSLDRHVEKGRLSEREGTAYGLDHVMRLMSVVGVTSWEDMPGKQILVLFPNGSHLGQVAKGIANPLTGAVLILSEHAEEWKDRELS